MKRLSIKIFYVIAAFLLNLASPLAANYNLSIGAIFQQEAPYLKEWIDYHKKIGVEHFWLYNNNSTDKYLEVLEPYIQEGIVTLIDWPSTYTDQEFIHFCFQVQVDAYNDAIVRTRGVSKWLALIDIDEFIVPMIEDNLLVLLEKYYWYVSGLCVNWQTYGTSGVDKLAPGESMLRRLLWKCCVDDERNKYHKSIVQPLQVSHCINPHQCVYLPGHFHVTPNLEKVEGNFSSGVYVDKIRLNHYWTRDEYFLVNVKMPRRAKWDQAPETILQMALPLNAVKDDCILRLLD